MQFYLKFYLQKCGMTYMYWQLLKLMQTELVLKVMQKVESREAHHVWRIVHVREPLL